MLIDLHVHTSISACSRLRLDDILKTARNRGLDGVCLTDHDTMEVGRQVQEGFQKDGLLVIVGMEYATPGGDFLVFGPYENLQPGLSAPELLDHIRNTGGAAVAAHPCRPGRPLDKSLLKNGSCRIIEAINGRDMARVPDDIRPCMKGVLPIQVGGSDAHAPDELGVAATRFDVPIRNRSDLIEALNAGNCRPERPVPIVNGRPALSKQKTEGRCDKAATHHCTLPF